MRGRGVAGALVASPTMVGAVTVLISIVAVFLAYNANTGLPFVPTYRLSADVPNANSLVAGNDVRVGGVRVGTVEAIEPQQGEDGTASARLDLKLDSDLEPLPVDSSLVIRSRSALGLKYLEIEQGEASEGYEAGAVIPTSAYGFGRLDSPGCEEEGPADPAAENPCLSQPVEIDDVFNTFDEPTRLAIRENFVEFGNALAGRGPELNLAIGRLPRVLEFLEPVTRNLASPRTGLSRFVAGAAAAAAEVAPVAALQGELFVSLDATFTALAGVSPQVAETIRESVPTLEVGSRTLPAIRPFLDHSADLFARLNPGVESIRANSPVIASSLESGAPVLRASPALNRELAPTAESLAAFSADAGVREGLARLRQSVDLLGPTARFITPAQTVCNYGSLLFRNLASTVSQGGATGGTFQRFTVFDPPLGPNDEGGVAAAPANGGGDPTNFLHYNPYPNTAAPGQTRECEAGNEPFLAGRQVIGNVPGNQGVVTDDQPGISDDAADEAAGGG